MTWKNDFFPKKVLIQRFEGGEFADFYTSEGSSIMFFTFNSHTLNSFSYDFNEEGTYRIRE
ncbi:MAG TPA: hypothetical protein P5191_06735 [Ruminococcus sp.]|nr:hypothetical protein [Ruminococcus sp.]